MRHLPLPTFEMIAGGSELAPINPNAAFSATDLSFSTHEKYHSFTGKTYYVDNRYATIKPLTVAQEFNAVADPYAKILNYFVQRVWNVFSAHLPFPILGLIAGGAVKCSYRVEVD